jgi:hypothetical protein
MKIAAYLDQGRPVAGVRIEIDGIGILANPVR